MLTRQQKIDKILNAMQSWEIKYLLEWASNAREEMLNNLPDEELNKELEDENL